MGAKRTLLRIIIVDTASLARHLGVSITAVKNRAKNLDLTPEEVSAGRGRPKQIWNPSQVEAISTYGQASAAGHEEWVEDSESAGQLAVTSAQSEIVSALNSQLASFDDQCQALEDRFAEALAARAAIIPSRSWEKASSLLRSGSMGCDLAGFGAVPLTPRLKAISGDRFPAEV